MILKDKVIKALTDYAQRALNGEVTPPDLYYGRTAEILGEGAYGIVAQVVMDHANAREWGMVTDLLFKEIEDRPRRPLVSGEERALLLWAESMVRNGFEGIAARRIIEDEGFYLPDSMCEYLDALSPMNVPPAI